MPFLLGKNGNMLFVFLRFNFLFQWDCMKGPFDNQMINLKEEFLGRSYRIILGQS